MSSAVPRRNRRLEGLRERVIDEARDLLIERGLADLTLAELARRVETSPGHLLYYFASKDELLLEVLRASEAEMAAERQALVEGDAPLDERLRAFCRLYLPRSAGDPRWLLWIELWPRVLRVDELRVPHRELDAAWQDDLALLLGRAGIAGAEGVARRLCAALDGLSIALTLEEDGLSIDSAIDHAVALLPH